MITPLRNLVPSIACVALLFASACPVTSAESPKTKDSPAKNADRYSAAGLRQAFAALCEKLGYRALVVEIDQAESPFVLFGVLEGRCDYRAIQKGLSSMRGYAYDGCVTAVRPDGTATIFALRAHFKTF